MTGIIDQNVNPKQRATLDKIHADITGFHEGNDNTVTYALTGLIMELTKSGYQDPHYVREKVDLIFGKREE